DQGADFVLRWEYPIWVVTLGSPKLHIARHVMKDKTPLLCGADDGPERGKALLGHCPRAVTEHPVEEITDVNCAQFREQQMPYLWLNVVLHMAAIGMQRSPLKLL